MPTCPHCGTPWVTDGLLEKHLADCERAGEEETPPRCPHCGRGTPTPHAHRTHLRSCPENPEVHAAARAAEAAARGEQERSRARERARAAARHEELRAQAEAPVLFPSDPPLELRFRFDPEDACCSLEVDGVPWTVSFVETTARTVGQGTRRTRFPAQQLPRLRRACEVAARPTGAGWEVDTSEHLRSESSPVAVFTRDRVRVWPEERRLEVAFHTDAE